MNKKEWRGTYLFISDLSSSQGGAAERLEAPSNADEPRLIANPTAYAAPCSDLSNPGAVIARKISSFWNLSSRISLLKSLSRSMRFYQSLW